MAGPVSIHASAREATYSATNSLPGVGVSIHASAREATKRENAFSSMLLSFNPRLRTGGDSPRWVDRGGFACFNPRLRTGGDL